MKNDRFTKAYELRVRLHAWLKENPNSLMEDIFQANSDIPHETIRKCIYGMRNTQTVKMIGRRGLAGRFSVLSDYVKTEEEVRELMRKCGMETYENIQNWNNRKKQQAELATADKFKRCEVERQDILDILNKQDSLTSMQLAEILHINPDAALRTIYRMEEEGEVVRNGKGKKQTFTAITLTTVSADEMRKRIELRKQETKEQRNRNCKRVAEIQQVAGYYRHRDHRNPDVEKPLKNQEGIGSGRSRVYIDCSQVW